MFAIAVHGGAGALSRRDTSAEQEQAYRAGLSEALDAGYAMLERGAASLDAAILHGGNMPLGHIQAGTIKAGGWRVIRKGIKALLIPGLREPGVVKRGADGKGRL